MYGVFIYACFFIIVRTKTGAQSVFLFCSFLYIDIIGSIDGLKYVFLVWLKKQTKKNLMWFVVKVVSVVCGDLGSVFKAPNSKKKNKKKHCSFYRPLIYLFLYPAHKHWYSLGRV